MDEENPLQVWLTRNGISKVAFGKRVDCSDAHINRICKGDLRVSTELAVRIFKESGIRVGPLRNATMKDATVVARVLSEEAAA